MIRLFHQEAECYLVAEGSFAYENKIIVEKGIHTSVAVCSYLI